VLCYRADIEMALRTPGFGGFHLLDLQDFPGQGTALIGMLDAFMDSKGLISPEEFSQFCNRVVPLLIIDKYCWTNNEEFSGRIKIANYSDVSFNRQKVTWTLHNADNEVIESGELLSDINRGGLTEAGALSISLAEVQKAGRLTLTLAIEGTPYLNSYPLWVYPSATEVNIPESITVADKLDKALMGKLAEGADVLLFPDHAAISDMSVGGLFIPDYWNYRMFKGISEANRKPVSPGTMAILTDPALALFNDFPTEFHTNWQWWTVVKNSRPFILDNAPEGYKPLVQVVDNVERNHKLGLIFEFRVGKGRLLVCMADLRLLTGKPEAKQLYSSILKYMSSEDFNPGALLEPDQLTALFSTRVTGKNISGVANISYN
jgi:hypothetical protein